jgi:hypothetical protein
MRQPPGIPWAAVVVLRCDYNAIARIPQRLCAIPDHRAERRLRSLVMPGNWLVEYHAEAVEEQQKLRDPKQRRGVLQAIAHLRATGPAAKQPQMKRVVGTRGLCELRPSGGTALVRPLYIRFDERTFKVLAIAPEALVDPSGFRAAVERARRRAHDGYGISL